MEFPIVLKREELWSANSVLVFDVENTADYMVNLYVTFRGAGNEVGVRYGTFPHWPCRFAVPFELASGKQLFITRTPGCFKGTVSGANLSFDDLEEIHIRPAEGGEGDMHFGDFEICDAMPTEYPMPPEPLVDDLHQWRGKDWSGKAKSMDDVREALNRELDEPAPSFPAQWSEYGGWREKVFRATGFFRHEHDGNRWWLVDPTGCAFWSIGIDCVRYTNAVNVTGIESVFEKPLPAKDDPLWSCGETLQFDALVHNLQRVLGDDWKEQWMELTRRRLLKYRFNTIANWSDRELQKRSKIPYVFTMKDYPGTDAMIFRDFPDVYAAEYQRNAESFAAQLEEIQEDRFVIGYFMTNEPKWAFVQGFDLGAQLLLTDEPSASMDKLIEKLKETYPDIDALNQAWGASLTSFEDLREKQTPGAWPGSEADTLAFTKDAVERYVRVPAAACRAVAPNHLNLGLRWAWIHSDYQLAGAEVLDAFSINCYQLKPDPQEIADIVAKTGKPMMIGEFHVGSLDRGLPSGGIRNTETMVESVDAYRYYIENAAAIPGLLGVHYFKWDDQHVMGRRDGENMQIGLHDITGRAYPEWADMCRAVHQNLYRIINDEAEPYGKEPNAIRQGTLCW